MRREGEGIEGREWRESRRRGGERGMTDKAAIENIERERGRGRIRQLDFIARQETGLIIVR